MKTDSVKCPSCGIDSSGKFCHMCGTTLSQMYCTQCGAVAEAGSRFCNVCGSRLGADGHGPPASRTPAPDDSNRAAWWLAGGMLAALIVFVAIPAVQRANSDSRAMSAPTGASPAAPFATPAPDISQMTPIEAADRLYTRVMTAAGAADSAQVTMFLPMSIAAYERARPLDADGLFHLSLLRRMALDPAGARDAAEEALAAFPSHLLNLGAAAGALRDLGDVEGARAYYQRFLDQYDAEMAKGLEEYGLHADLLVGLREEASEFVGG